MAVYTAIDDPSAYFKVQLWTGDGVDATEGGGGHAIVFDDTDTNMQPDLVWTAERSSTSGNQLIDSVRGVTKHLESEDNGQESEQLEGLTTFGSDGFTVGDNGAVNQDSQTYVAWAWKESATSGFDIVAYTGSGSAENISHSLSAAPTLLIIKRRGGAASWCVGHGSPGFTKFLQLDVTDAILTATNRFNDTAPTSSVFSIGGDSTQTNVDGGDTYVAYAFAEKQGFSKFGSYEGNGNADGTFVYLGFRPAFVMTKSMDSTSSWHMFDNKREGYNVDNDPLLAEATTAEATTDMIDLLSNGFKLRIATDPNVAETYVYVAFAEAPFVNSNGVPCNAR